MKFKYKVMLGGGIIGLIAAVLANLGNPGNMGFCIACFFRDISGALGLQSNEAVQYIRPEIIGLILGAFLAAFIGKEFRARGGSAPVLRFAFGFFLIVGALVFLGCPTRMIIRLAGGDLNALVGLLGFVVGVGGGIIFLKNGFSLGRSYKQNQTAGIIFPVFAVVLLVFAIIQPAFIKMGPEIKHAPLFISLVAGLIVGVIAQRTRMCTAGAVRDVVLLKDFTLATGIIALFVGVVAGNLLLNPEIYANIGFLNQPVAHTDGIWNFLGMLLVGLVACMLGGCPFRQSILAAEGDNDAVITVFGMFVGAACAHNWGLAASAKGVPANGQLAVIIGIAFVIVVGVSVIIISKKQTAK